MLAVVIFKPGDDGQVLKCVYEHEANLPDVAYEDGFNITVHCKLKIKCSSGREVQSEEPQWPNFLFSHGQLIF